MFDRARLMVARWLLKDNPVGSLLDPYYSDGIGIAPPEGYEALSEQGYKNCAIGKAAVDKVADCAASMPIKLQKKGKGGNWEDMDASNDDEHPLMTLLDNPNPGMTRVDLFGYVFKNRLMVGEGAIAQVGPSASSPPQELWPLRTDKMFCHPNDRGSVGRWVYKTGKGEHTFDMDVGEGQMLPVMFWKTFNPLDPWRGVAPLGAAGMQIVQHNEASKWNAKMLKNGMRPMGAFKYTAGEKSGRALSTGQRKQLEADINSRLMGSNNAGRPLILDGMDWQDLSMSAKDLDWLEGRRDADRIISLVVGCPPIMLGIPGDSTYRNMEEARFGLYQDSAIPLLQGLLDQLNRWIVPSYGKGLRLVIDKRKIDALVDFYAKEEDRIDKLTCYTTDEKRVKMGLPELGSPAAKVVFISSSMVPLDLAAEPPPEPDMEGEVDEDGEPIEPEAGKPGKKPPFGKPIGKPKVPAPVSKGIKALEDNLLKMAAAYR